jgi:dTMP kinase
MANGIFITFEGTEGSGKSTQIQRLAGRLRSLSQDVLLLREPGGTDIGEEIRHTLKHSPKNTAMRPETELLLMNASRAQLVREIIRPALDQGRLVLCDRFYDSTVVYQGYGRGLNLQQTQAIIDFAVGDTRPHLTLLLHVPLPVSLARRQQRQGQQIPLRDRFEEADQAFFERVERGYLELAKQEPDRLRLIDATRSLDEVFAEIWTHTSALLSARQP